MNETFMLQPVMHAQALKRINEKEYMREAEDWNKIDAESSVQVLICFPEHTSSPPENINMMIEYYLA